MEWGLTIYHDRKNIRLLAKVVYSSDQIERIQIRGKNRSITLQSNRPFLEKKGLKQKRIDWKLIEGTMNNAYLLQMIINTVESHLKGKERSFPRLPKPYKN